MNNKKLLVSVLGILGILIATVGVTYAFFSYSRTGTKENKISSGNITFLYTEASQGITLNDAMPMTDTEGKGQSNYFDFRVTSNVGSEMRIPYTVTVLPNTSNIPAQYVKLYLTDQSNNEIEVVRTLSSLDSYNNTVTGLTGEKVLYEGEVPAGTNNYNKLFRLRMWLADNIDMSPITQYKCNNEVVAYGSEAYNNCSPSNLTSEDIYPYNGEEFSIKVNVYGEGKTTNQTEAELRANTNIETITVSGNDVTKIDNNHYEQSVAIGDVQSVTIPIVVDTENDNAEVIVEEVDSIGAVIKESKLKPVAITRNVTVDKGTHYFKITVKPEDKSTPAIYYLTVNVVEALVGLFDLNDNIIASWNYLVNTYNLNVEKDYTSSNFSTDNGSAGNSMKYIIDTYYTDYNNIKVVMPNTITKIGNYVFNNLTKLKSIVISNTVTTIGNFAFTSSGLTSLDIPNGVTTIGSSAFYGNNSLTSVTMANSVTSIGASCFGACRNLTSITLSNNLTVLSQYMLYTCDKLTNVTIPNGVTTIEDYVFNSSSIATLYIPASVTHIGRHQFGNNKITSVTFENTNGWFATNNIGATSGTNIDVTNPTTNATNMISRTNGSNINNIDNYWKRDTSVN